MYMHTACVHVSRLTSLLVELYFEVSGQDDVEVTCLVQRLHLISAQLEALLVVVSTDIHERLLALGIQVKVITFVPL